MKITRLALISLLCAAALASCGGKKDNPYRMDYTVAMDTVGHYLLVDLDLSMAPGSGTVTLNMPRWTPGYYEMLDYPKHLCDFSAADPAGKAVAWEKSGMNRWVVSVPDDGRVRVSYRIYANRRDVGSSRVESDIAFVSPAGVFMHVDGDLQHPVRVRFDLPGNWEKISSGLLPVEGATDTFQADDFDRLYDCPFLLGNYYTCDFEHEGHPYHFAVETPEGIEESGFREDFCRIVSAATRLMGEVPYDNYCLIHMGAGGGGLEHWNSQACYTDGTYRFADRGRQNNAEAAKYINLVRNRALLPDFTGDIRAAYRYERQMELLFEGQWWFDKRRWKEMDQEYNAAPIIGCKIVKYPDGHKTYDLNNVIDQRVWNGDKCYFYPIPQDELNKSSKLKEQYKTYPF